jgi:putative membrane protein
VGDPRLGELDPRDFSRRTLLANERTYLAWWRTGLTTLTVALAVARVLPELGDAGTRWPYTVIGLAFAGVGTWSIAYAEHRRRSVDRAVRAGEFADPDPRVMLAFTASGVLLGAALAVLILVAP